MSDTDFTRDEYASSNSGGFTVLKLNIGPNFEVAKDKQPEDEAFLDAFRRLVSSPELKKYVCRVARGFTMCPICSEISYTKVDGSTAYINNAEIWIPDFPSMTIYAAPFLLVHYVLNHGYIPSEEYRRVVVDLEPDSKFQFCDAACHTPD